MRTKYILLLCLAILSLTNHSYAQTKLPQLSDWEIISTKKGTLNEGKKIKKDLSKPTLSTSEHETSIYRVLDADNTYHLTIITTAINTYHSSHMIKEERIELKHLHVSSNKPEELHFDDQQTPANKYILPIENEVLTINDAITTTPTIFSKKTIHIQQKPSRASLNRTIISNKKRAFFYTSINFTPAIAYRSIHVNQPQFADYSAIEKRGDNERAVFGYSSDVQIGVTFNKNHTLGVEACYTKQGFNNTKDSLNWQTGLAVSTTTQHENNYSFRYGGIGIFYNYNSYYSVVNPVFEVGIRYMYADNRMTNSYDGTELPPSTQRSIGIRPNQITGKIGLGFSIRPSYGTSIKVMPTMLYNLTSTGSDILTSRMYNIGITTGIAFRI